MKYLNNFDKFSLINEDKPARAERNKKKAEGLIDDIENAIKAGDEKKANRLLKKAAKKVDKAEDLNPSIDTEELATELTNLKQEIDNPKDDFGMVSKEHRDKIKLTKFDIINKIKILGDEISNDELDAFLKTVINYINEYWDELKNNENFPKEYISPYTDLEIRVKKNISGIIFLYKEGANDKVKIKFSKEDFSDDENKEEIIKEIRDVLDSENLKHEISNNYIESNDDNKHEPISKPEQNYIPEISPAIANKTEYIVSKLTEKDEKFISDAVKLLIGEKLNIGFSNTDEDKIFDFFVKKNSHKCIVPDNINEILIRYRKKKATMNEAWYNNTNDFLDATVGSTQRGTQSMRTHDSKGVVGDLMWAFNSDAKTLSDDINEMLRKIGTAYQKELNKGIEKLSNIGVIKEDVDMSSLLSGMLASGYVLKKSPKLANLVGIRGGSSLATRGAGSTVTRGGSSLATRGAGSTVARGGLAGISRLGGLLANPYVWIGIAVVAAIGGGWYLWDTIDEQQNQLATIIMLMWASGSTEFHKELKQNGINIKAPTIDVSKLNNLIKSGELFSEPSEKTSSDETSEVTTEEETFENRKIKSFKDFIK